MSLILGEICEEHFRKYLIRKGYMTYIPEDKNKPHCFDFVVTYKKEKLFFCDVKFKRHGVHIKGNFGKRFHGINVSSHNEYLSFAKKNSADFYLVFYDLEQKTVYKVNVADLKDPQYVYNDKIICWDVSQMKKVFTLLPDIIDEINSKIN